MGVLIRLQNRLLNPPRPSGMSYSCSGMVCGRSVSRAVSKEACTLLTPPSASLSDGLPGKASKTGTPISSSRLRPVVLRYASLASTMTRSGVITRNGIGSDPKTAAKSIVPSRLSPEPTPTPFPCPTVGRSRRGYPAGGARPSWSDEQRGADEDLGAVGAVGVPSPAGISFDPEPVMDLGVVPFAHQPGESRLQA